MVRDPESGKYRRTRLFVMTLGYSRKSIRLLVFRSSTRTWAELHKKAFPRLGGSPRVVVLDNLREGVLTPDLYDPILNPLFKEVLAHYGVTAMPCRIKDPDRKGKVESGVRHAQKTPLKDSVLKAWTRLKPISINGSCDGPYAHPRQDKAASCGDVRGRKTVAASLPIEPFRYYQYGDRTVHLDGCIEVEAAYSLPPGWIGKRVKAQWDGLTFVSLDPGASLLREHVRQQRGLHRIRIEDTHQTTPVKDGATVGARRSRRIAHR
jgi:hypothetical protein